MNTFNASQGSAIPGHSKIKRAEPGLQSEVTNHSIKFSNTDRVQSLAEPAQTVSRFERNLRAESLYGFGVSVPKKPITRKEIKKRQDAMEKKFQNMKRPVDQRFFATR